MKLTIELPVDVAEGLGTLAIHEHRTMPQQAGWMLTRWFREVQAQPTEGARAHWLLRTGLIPRTPGETPPEPQEALTP